LGDLIEAADDDALATLAFGALEWKLHLIEHAEDHDDGPASSKTAQLKRPDALFRGERSERAGAGRRAMRRNLDGHTDDSTPGAALRLLWRVPPDCAGLAPTAAIRKMTGAVTQ
jgi:hypothetical protein